MSHLQLSDTARYLLRLGFDTPPAPTLDTLRQLQRRHTAEFPFETLSTLLRQPVPIDLESVERKVFEQGRGGYCYELNQLFFALLLELGFDARGITGRVVMNAPEGSWAARTHRLSLVTLDGVRYITDVGFGGMVPTAPLLLDSREAQTTPHELYRIETHADGYLLRANVDDEWRPMYLFDLQRQEDIDYTLGNWYVSSHPESPFMGRLMVARTGDGLRKTLNGNSYAVHRIGQQSERRVIADADELIDLLEQEFGLRVPPRELLRPAIVKVLQP
ncbi:MULTISPECIES: arylamine N-acetyltransferase [unclassified Pseudomonas]|uniref:arylamine N-acetyltransferase family protein n=1 Tax=unclassified Pseudomonas TaxID=196821 RepID=UPI000871A87B|nr:MULTISPECIES: arylamine N-acetyltransferase [unclassified Pseudomonas]SCW28605.1 N-hydroxyarylamine O-acetyltransferase [Pseudomonas sp. NFACC05-1]SDX78615.1 N-hydroxyarylamine O-acetyltransferase [Pseudomonas sp. NFACC08-1]SEI59917.1 N-hydroxyarylamine O-acetyltransferase [Pseudomonas sp. NFACC07-1]SFL10420.1 N-hydroxyarylamine O-acetyltransferase [Pseudomonas sp. NFACC46-3]